VKTTCLAIALMWYVVPTVCWFVGVAAGWHGNYAKGTFFLALALGFHAYGVHAIREAEKAKR
jgi:hypothetical protein